MGTHNRKAQSRPFVAMPDATPLVHAKAEVYLYKDVRSSILENRIRKMRKTKGWTQAELAKAVGVTQAQVAKWEHEEANPSRKTLLKLASAFGCEAGYLV
ncbi:XRE family transcriptional regulator [bacterium]|nr:MAG: XRE family transcriptional regulator [bacterium]